MILGATSPLMGRMFSLASEPIMGLLSRAIMFPRCRVTRLPLGGEFLRSMGGSAGSGCFWAAMGLGPGIAMVFGRELGSTMASLGFGGLPRPLFGGGACWLSDEAAAGAGFGGDA